MIADEPDESREPVAFRDEVGDLIFVDDGPAPQGYALVTQEPGEDGSRFVVDPAVDVVAVICTISKHRPRWREPIE